MPSKDKDYKTTSIRDEKNGKLPLHLLQIFREMTHVSVESIEKAIQKVDNLNDDGLEKLSETYALAQQVLLGYIMSAATEYQNPQLEGLLIYYYCLISETFAQQNIRLNQISEDDIDQFEEPYFEVLDEYFKTEKEDVLHDFIEQPDMIRFMMIEISTEDDDGTSLDDDTATQLFVVSAAMIGLMNRAIIRE